MRTLLFSLLLTITASAQNFSMTAFPAAGGGGGGTTLRTNLVGYWAMEAASAANQPDSTPRANTLTAHGASTQDPVHIGGSFSVDLGASPYLDSGSTDLVFGGAGAYSGILWIYSTANFNDSTPMIAEWNTGTKFILWERLITAQNIVEFIQRNPGNTANVVVDSAVNCSLNAWHLIAYGFDPANNVIWIQVDNEARKTTAYTGTPPTPSVTTDKFTIGNYSLGTGSGAINLHYDEAAFWTRTLTTTEVSAIWNSGVGTFYATWN